MATELPDLNIATAVHFGGKWVQVNGAVDQGDGWVTLDVGGYQKANVRASAIHGVRYSSVPAQPAMPTMPAFDLEVL